VPASECLVTAVTLRAGAGRHAPIMVPTVQAKGMNRAGGAPAAPTGAAQPPAAGPRRVSWDVLRVLAVLAVVTFHATFLGPLVEPTLQARRFSFPLQVGAASLLMISAFFVCQSLARARPWHFWWNRVSRLLPPFVVSVLLTWAVVQVAAPDDWFRPSVYELIGNLLMLWAAFPEDVPFIDGSYWTLPLQLLAFTVAAVLAVQRRARGTTARVVLWSAVLVPLVQVPLRAAEPPELYRAVVDSFGFHRLHLLVLGVGVWMWSTRRIGHLHGLALALCCLVANGVHTLDIASTLALTVCVALICLAARGPDWGRSLPVPAQRVVRWLAGISYGVYLLHQTLGYLVMRKVNDLGGGQVLETLAMGVAAVLLGWLLTRWVERPVHRAAVKLAG
jgi:peptidoglycan/LPS O-acetylase OafA/YrhL